MVIVVQAVPMLPENLQAVLVDVFEPDSSPYQRIVANAASLSTYTLAAHLVTFLPSFKQSNSPRP